MDRTDHHSDRHSDRHRDRIEDHLTDLDDHLIAQGIEPARRVAYIEEAADALLSSGADPVEELGTAESYARQLADALDAPRRAVWLRVLAAFAGGTLSIASIAGLVLPAASLDSLDSLSSSEPVTLPVSAMTFGALAGLTTWFMFSPVGIRLFGSRLSRWRRLLAAAPVVLLILVLRRQFGTVDPELGSVPLPITFPLWLLCGAASVRLLMVSGYFQSFSTGPRRSSTLTYSPYSRRKVTVYRRQPPPPSPVS